MRWRDVRVLSVWVGRRVRKMEGSGGFDSAGEKEEEG